MFRILLVEDNPGYISLTIESFKEWKIEHQLDVVEDGEEAMDFLKHRGKYIDAKYPDIILLDLNLPKKDGRDILKEIKNDPILKRTPVIILTTSIDDEDVVKAYDNHANCYIRKPVDLVGFLDVVKKTEDFWLSVSKLPPAS
ncbi:MAG: response regulator [Candidatus Omnitrophica bacterium]|nr:response regulator [Candidatus Omnitrophota bacterium]